jgi:hypothetical protein
MLGYVSVDVGPSEMQFLFFAAVLGLIPAFIARGKGRPFPLWWLYGALLFIVALIHSLVLKDQSGVKCPHCAEFVSREARVCKHCGRDLVPAA